MESVRSIVVGFSAFAEGGTDGIIKSWIPWLAVPRHFTKRLHVAHLIFDQGK